MSLSLELRKFINSKHTGEYVEVILPGELPTSRSDAKAVQKDNSAAEGATRKAKELVSAKANAEKSYKSAQEAVKKAAADLERAEKELAEHERNKEHIQPEYDEKRKTFDVVKQDYNSKKAENDRCNDELRYAEDKRKKADQILKAATAATEAPDNEQKAKLEKELEEAVAITAEKRKLSDAAAAAVAEAEKKYRSKKSEFDGISAKIKTANAAVQSATTARNVLRDKLSKLSNREKAAKERFQKLSADSERAENEAAKLKKNIRVIETKYETAMFHYTETGKGEPIILVHGAGQSLYTFNKIFYKLGMNYRVILLDLAGHGYSDRPDFFDYSVSDHAESLARFMDALGIETAHFVGFSMGAGFVLELARKYPERVDKLVLISPGGVTAEMPLSVRMLESGLFGVFAGRIFSPKSVAKLLDGCVFDHTIVKQHDIEQYSQPFVNPNTRYGVRRTINAYDEDDVISGLRDVEAETLILWGDEDKWHPVESRHIYLAALKNAEFAQVRNTGHLPHEERPDRVCELIKGFIPAGYEIGD